MKITKHILYCTVILLALILLVSACKKENGKIFSIEGKLENTNGSYLLFIKELPTDTLAIDTIKIDKDGSFSFKSEIDTLTFARLFFNQQGRAISVFVDKGWKIKISGDASTPDLVEVSGGEANDDLTDFKKKNKSLLAKRNRIYKDLENKKGDSESLQTELMNISFELTGKARDYIKKNPAKIASVVIIHHFYKDNSMADRLEEQLNSLQSPAKSFYLTEELHLFNQSIKQSRVGAQAPYFSLPDINGKRMSLNDFRGKYVLLSFLSAVCPVCEANMPYLLDASKALKQKKMDVKFMSIYLDSDKKVVKDKKNSLPADWITLIDVQEWAAEPVSTYNITEIPYSILISPEGKIVERGISATELVSKLEELIKNNNKQ
ncbi:peroxiredoxin [Dysgonomonas sp. PH5-45]|uniref:DUF4369 domain-containing protein n=1 Tax=unclassified Dysgonomonas TaxID=2630389 RepID=UPI002475675D|nr:MULTISPECIES: DUF4369 domain-containing protein [unclassified Dysgonomonas]MDH6354302.1 peroxiredoxin [Dysgonomonas sp. PH5-45]MDH6387203.1 peroxiredoxin [Dysgonomonas sp. PH5-37]